MELIEYKWAVVVGAIFCFTLGGGMGANDVANNFGTSVGSRSISLKNALVIAAVFELIGSVGLGSTVTDSVRKGVYDPDAFGAMPDFLLMANLTALITVTIWLFTASFLKMSVSTTHSLIGSFMGCGVAIGWDAVHWSYLLTILASWFIAPVFSMIVASCLFISIRQVILRASNPVRRGNILLPLLVLYISTVICLFLTFSNPVVLSNRSCEQLIDGLIETEEPCKIARWVDAHKGISWGIGIASSVVLALILYWPCKLWISESMKYDEREAEDRKLAIMMAAAEEGSSSEASEATSEGHAQTGCKGKAKEALAKAPWNRDLHNEVIDGNERINQLAMLTEKFDWRGEAFFKALQTVSAALACLVHGSNDVSNAAAPFASIYSIYEEGEFLKSVTVPIWVLFLAGSSISIGLMLLGYKVIQTVGIELLHMSAPKGFCVEMAIFTIIIIGSFSGLSLSSTHVGVGAMIGVGLMDRHIDPETGEDITKKTLGYLNMNSINWRLAGKLAVSWVGTIVLCAIMAFLIFSFSIKSPTKIQRFLPCPGGVKDGICIQI